VPLSVYVDAAPSSSRCASIGSAANFIGVCVGSFGLVIGVGPAARAPDLLKHGADDVVANLGEVRLEGTAHLP